MSKCFTRIPQRESYMMASCNKGKTGKKQDCVLSPFLFSVDFWQKKRLKDLYFADNIALLPQRFLDMQKKTDDTADNAKPMSKTKHMRINCTSSEPVWLHGADMEEGDEFMYLGSKMTSNGSCDEEVNVGLVKLLVCCRAHGEVEE